MKLPGNSPRLLRSRHPRGVVFLGILLAVGIVLILSGMYFQPVGVGGGATVPMAMYQIQRARDISCTSNRRSLQVNAIESALSFGNRMNGRALHDAVTARSRCPGGGRYYVSDQEVYCTLHAETPTFAEMFGIL